MRRLVGRDTDLARLDALLASHRLVTIWGPAGIGKTGLARAVLERSVAGVFCDLSAARTAAAICASVAATLDAPLGDGGATGDAAERVARVLATRGELLLVLDNFEQLVAHGAATVGRWLEHDLRVRFVVTSRERLRLREEAAHELAPLQPAHAVELFVERTIEAGGEIADADSPRIGALVERLDRVPLTIELAAARMGVLGLDGVIERLARRLDLLSVGFRDADERHATLRGALEWSWELLEPAEQTALAECSVFGGPSRVIDAEAVLSTGACALDRLQSLRDKSLLQLTAGPSPRLRMLESVRLLASDKLDGTGARREIERRHATWFLSLCSAPGARLAALSAELLLITERFVERSPRDAADALLALEPVLSRRGPADLLVAHLDTLAEHLSELDPDRAARVLAARGRAHQVRGRAEEAEASFEHALRLVRDESLEASIVTDLGVLYHGLRRTEDARRCYDRALARGPEDPVARARLRGNLGALAHDLLEFDVAYEAYEGALEELGSSGDDRLRGIVLTNLAVLDQELGDLARASARFGEALELLARSDDRRLEAIALGNLGMLHHERGDLEAALEAHERALVQLRATLDVRSEVLCRARLAAVLARLARADEARAQLEVAERLTTEMTDPMAEAAVTIYAAFVDLADAGPGRSPEHLAQARARVEAVHRVPEGARRSPAELSDDVRAALRLLRPMVAQLDADAGALPARALALTRGARRARPPGGDWQELGRHRVLRDVLSSLAEQHRVAPGRGLSIDAIRRAVWPGERMRPDAARNRIHVAVSKLRKLGLRDWLLTTEDGYALEPHLELRWVEDGAIKRG